ncbi:MAG: type II toxin-antitoxin system HipA family toxin [Tannerellaceae bacterium]
MNSIEILEIWMNQEQVGRMALTPDGLCSFEYNTEYLKSGVSISPYYLPLRPGLIVAKRDPFNGNFGVFDDSLPDGWGSLLLDRFLQEKGINPYKLSVLQRLSLIGTTGRGALMYYPDKSITSNADFLDFDKLAAEAERLLKDKESNESIDELYAYGGSSGGARPKVFASIDGKQWLVKFKATSDPYDIGITEYQYSLLAKECGIRMPETRLIDGKYFGVERFDRGTNKRIHTISAAGLLHANYRIPSLDYSILLKVCLNLTKDMEQVHELFRILVFNVIISNRDDHAKNFSFQLIDKEWKLSPAYDLLPSNGFNGYHTTTINGKGEPTMSDIKSVASEVGISHVRATQIIDEISEKCKLAKMAKFIIQP